VSVVGPPTGQDGPVTRPLRVALLLVLAALPAVMVLMSTRTGPGLSQDSVSYLSTARSFGAGNGLVSFTGEPLTLFPPGLPVVLGAAEAIGWRAENAAVALNALCAALVVLGAYVLARWCGLGRAGALAAAAFTSVSTATVGVFAWLWTEPLFTVLVLAVLLILVRLIRIGRVGWGSAVGVAAMVSAATTVRYIGLVLVAVAALGTWLALREAEPRRRWRWTLIVSAASAIGLIAVALRNLTAGSGPLGERYPGTRTMEGAFKATVDVLGSYVAPPAATMLTAEAGVVVGLIILIGAWIAVMGRDRPIVLLAGFGLLYIVAIVWSQAATRLDTASTRLLAPAFVPLLVIAIYGIRAIVAGMRLQLSRWASSSPSAAIRRRGDEVAGLALWTIVWGAFALVLAVVIVQDARFVQQARADGLGLAASASASELAGAVQSSEGSASNDPWRTYLRVGHPPVLYLPPSAAEWPADRVLADTNRLVAAVRAGTVTQAAVFAEAGAIEPLAALVEAGIEVDLLAEYADGTLYRLSPAR
jgi:hypothetical protein